MAAGQSLLLLYYAQLKADKMESVCEFCDWEKTALDQISFSLVDNLILSSLGMWILQETVSSEEWKRKKDEYRRKKDMAIQRAKKKS